MRTQHCRDGEGSSSFIIRAAGDFGNGRTKRDDRGVCVDVAGLHAMSVRFLVRPSIGLNSPSQRGEPFLEGECMVPWSPETLPNSFSAFVEAARAGQVVEALPPSVKSIIGG